MLADRLTEMSERAYNLLPRARQRECPSCLCTDAAQNRFRIAGTKRTVEVFTCANEAGAGGDCATAFVIER